MRDAPDTALPPAMSLSVQIAPSRHLRALLFVAALVHAGAAGFILSGALDVALPWLLTGSSGMAAVLCAIAAAQPLNVRRIDISKAGALRLTVQQKLPGSGHAVRLLSGSLLWGQLLVLRFGSLDDAAVPPRTVVVLPDSMEREAFRALAVAMRAIAGHNGENETQKIG